MAFLPIKTQLVAILNTVSSVSVVYGKEEKELKKFPAICISADDYQGQYQTIGGVGGLNEEVYQHVIRVYFRTDETNDPDYEDVLESVVDDVIAALRHNITLNGACDWSLPISGTWNFGEKEVPVRIFEMKESATKIVTR